MSAFLLILLIVCLAVGTPALAVNAYKNAEPTPGTAQTEKQKSTQHIAKVVGYVYGTLIGLFFVGSFIGSIWEKDHRFDE